MSTALHRTATGQGKWHRGPSPQKYHLKNIISRHSARACLYLEMLGRREELLDGNGRVANEPRLEECEINVLALP
eukprot:7376536-Prymnesium_polylepis.1